MLRSVGISVRVDKSEFNLKKGIWDQNFLRGLHLGVAAALKQFMGDIVKEMPTVPILTSALRGSITYFVDNVLKGDSTAYGLPTFQERTSTDKMEGKGVLGVLGVNAPYATIQHEDFPHKSAPGAGRFYVLRKLIRSARHYVDIIVRTTKAECDRGL